MRIYLGIYLLGYLSRDLMGIYIYRDAMGDMLEVLLDVDQQSCFIARALMPKLWPSNGKSNTWD